jgi:phosphoribosylformylglycinamidine synthase
MLGVAEAARNVACAGAVPMGATNNLNFGNPERPEIMWQLVETIEGIAEACRALDVPITGGNVSLYNETGGRAIYPSPVLGIVGLIDDVTRAVGRGFPSGGLDLVVLGDNRGDIAGTEYLQVLHGIVRGRPPLPDLDHERRLHRLLPAAARAGLLASANDIAKGGLAVTVAEGCFAGGIGVEVDLPAVEPSALPAATATLFGETPGVVVVSVAPSVRHALLGLAGECGVSARVIGRTGGARLRIAVDGRPAIDADVATLTRRWAGALGDQLRLRPGQG